MSEMSPSAGSNQDVTMVRTELSNRVQTIAAFGNKLIAGIGHQVAVLSLDDPKSPQVVATSDSLSGRIYDVKSHSHDLILAMMSTGHGNYFIILHQKSTTELEVLSMVELGIGGLPRIVIQEDRAYFSYASFLEVYDISDPLKPNREIHIDSLMGTCHEATATEEWLYLLCVDVSANRSSIVPFDLSNPTNGMGKPLVVVGRGSGLVAAGNQMAVYDEGSCLLYFMNIQDSSRPELDGSLRVVRECPSMNVAQNSSHTAMVFTGNDTLVLTHPLHGLIVVDYLQEVRQREVKYSNRLIAGPGIVSRDGTLFVSDVSTQGIWTIDLPRAGIPSSVTSHNPFYAGQFVAVYKLGSTLVALSSNTSTLSLFALDDDNSWVTPTSISLGEGDWKRLTGYGRYALVGNDKVWLVVDVSDRTKPIVKGTIDADSNLRLVVVSEGISYWLRDDNVIELMDLNDPMTPKLVGSYISDGVIRNLRIDGNHLYVISQPTIRSYTGKLEVIDVTERSNPRAIGTLQFPSQLLGLAVVKNRVYITNGFSTLYIVDVSTFNDPRLLVTDLYSGGLDILSDGLLLYAYNIVVDTAEFVIYTLDNPLKPSPIARYSSIRNEIPRGLFVENATMYYVSGAGEILIDKFLGVSIPTATPLPTATSTPSTLFKSYLPTAFYQ